MLKLTDSRGWFSIGLYGLTVLIIVLLALSPGLQDNHLFATIAQAIIITGLINLAASFYFGASKSSTDTPDPKADPTKDAGQ